MVMPGGHKGGVQCLEPSSLPCYSLLLPVLLLLLEVLLPFSLVLSFCPLPLPPPLKLHCNVLTMTKLLLLLPIVFI